MWVSMVFQKKFNGCLREVSEVFQGFLRKSIRCFKEDFEVFRETFQGDSREVQGCLKYGQEVFQGSFKAVLKTF